VLTASLPAFLLAAPKPKSAPAGTTPPPSDKPLTEQDLVRALDNLKMGDPVQAKPMSVQDLTDKGPAPAVLSPGAATPTPASAPATAATPAKPVATPVPSSKPETFSPGTEEPAAPMASPPPHPQVKVPPSPDGKPANPPTEITAEEGSFDQKDHVGVFIKNVVVDNPQFHITCDKLTVYMNPDQPKDADANGPGAGKGGKGAKAAKAAATPAAKGATSAKGAPAVAKATKAGEAPAADAAAAPASGKKGKGSDPNSPASKIKIAIAEGNVVLMQDKVDPDGSVTHSVGHARKAVYVSATGDITLSGNPDCAQGINTLEATEDSTIIVLNSEGRMHAVGPHKSTIRDTAGADPTAPAGQDKATTKNQ
jgi:lipopolysaccharide export system protein LptA